MFNVVSESGMPWFITIHLVGGKVQRTGKLSPLHNCFLAKTPGANLSLVVLLTTGLITFLSYSSQFQNFISFLIREAAWPHELLHRRTMFQYQPLHRSQRASRLVVLQPGNGDDAIEYSIIEPLLLESFQTLLKYEALSYIWGDYTEAQDIQLEGSPSPLGKKLYSALLHLRYEDKVRLL
jgi:hypothetical protein